MINGHSEQKIIAAVQSCYIPWKGYFDIIAMVDEFIIFDDVQYTRRDWRNRNKIKTPKGTEWLSIAVNAKGNYYQKINEVTVVDKAWGASHWRTIKNNYAKADCFKEFSERFEELYCNCQETHLSLINYKFIKAVCEILNIKTKISWSSDYVLKEGKTERLVGLCQEANATHYVTGPAAKSYLNESLLNKENIGLIYMDYSHYPEYKQLFGPFEHAVTILDLIFNVGTKAREFMKNTQ